MPTPVIVTYVNDDHRSTWPGTRQDSLVSYDFTNADGRAHRYWALTDENVLIVRRPWPSPHVEWVVHLVDCRQTAGEPEQWTVTDREIDILVEPNLQTYRVIDLQEFGLAVASGSLGTDQASRIQTATQLFLDKYLHGGGHFPPAVITASMCRKQE